MAAQSDRMSVSDREGGPYGAGYLLPGPFTAVEQAARDAEMLRSPVARNSRPSISRARILSGAALAVVAVTLPDASLGGIGSAVARIEILNPQPPIAQNVGHAAVGLSALNYAPSSRPSALVPALVARRESATANAFEAEVAEDILQSGSQRFDLAFAVFARPSLEAPLVAGNPGLLVPKPLIANAPLTTPARDERGGAYHTINPDISVSQTSLRVDNSAFDTAFADPSEIANAGRSSPNTAMRVGPEGDEPYSSVEPIGIAIPVRAPQPEFGARAAMETALVQKASLPARINGVLAGSVDFQQGDGTIAIRLRSVVGILRDRFAANELDDLMAGKAIDAYVTLEQLQAIGVPIRYNPAYDEVEFGIDYEDAPQSDKVQIEQIGVGTTVDERAVIDQIGP